MKMKGLSLIVGGLALLFAGNVAMAGCPTKGVKELTGAGATFPYPLYSKMFNEYDKICNVKVNYQSIGSGGGIQQLKEQTVDFRASDGIMDEKQKSEAKGGAVLHIPTVAGAVAVVSNLPGVKRSQLKLSPDILADIYLKKISNWNDKRIQALNAGVKLPDLTIAVVHRSDGSGTTFIFTNYLSKVSADWKSKVGSNTSVEWPVGISAKGNEGVANNVAQTKGSIGYVEFAYAKQNKLTTIDMINKDGKVVAPNSASFQAAAASANWQKADGFYAILTEQSGAASRQPGRDDQRGPQRL